jgi:hypothetical protein
VSSLAHLPRAERVRRYRELAAEAYRDADRSKGAIQSSYQRLGEGWDLLANSVEGSIAPRATEIKNDQTQQQAALSRPSTLKR